MLSLSERLGTIRWKLTGAYVLIALLLSLTLAALSALGMVLLVNANLHLRSIAATAQDLATQFEPAFADGAPSPEQASPVLRRLAARDDRSFPIRVMPDGAPDQGERVPRVYYAVTVTNAAGRIITSTLPLALPTGAPLAGVEPAPAGQVLSAALAGATDTRALSGWIEPQHSPVAAAPVRDAQGRIAGAVYARVVGFPSTAALYETLRPFLGGGAVFATLSSICAGLLYGWLAGRYLTGRLRGLAEASTALAEGDLSRRLADRSPDEIGQLARQFNAMSERIAAQMHELRELAEQNARLAEQNAAFAAFEERNRMARELHDSVSQELFSLRMLAAAARRELDRRPDLVAGRLDEIQATARRALQETRSIIFALRPAALGERGLFSSLRDLVEDVRERQGLAVDLEIDGEGRLPLEYEHTLFRIVQEALANVARHSGASAAVITLRVAPERITLEIVDAGRGFDVSAPRRVQSYGLGSITERAAALGGAATITSAPGQGTRVLVELPAPAEVAPHAATDASAPHD